MEPFTGQASPQRTVCAPAAIFTDRFTDLNAWGELPERHPTASMERATRASQVKQSAGTYAPRG